MANNPYIRLEVNREGGELKLKIKSSCTSGEAEYMLSQLLIEMATDEKLSNEEAREFLASIITHVTSEVTMARGGRWINTYTEYMERRIEKLPFVHYADEGGFID